MNRTKELIQIKPTNNGTGSYSFSGGSPQIEFNISKMPKYCVGSSLRINGRINVYLADGTTRPINDNEADQVNVAFLDPRTGMSSVIDFISIANQEGQTYEMIKNYNKLCASLQQKHTSLSDYIEGGQNISYGANGKNNQQGLMNMKENTFSLKLLCGFLNSGLIDLNLVGGLHIVLQLAPDNFVLNNLFWTDNASVNTGMKYVLSDLELTFDAINPTTDEKTAMLANTKGEWEYNSFSNFYNVLASSDHTTTLNINTARTLGITCNMLPSKFLNNYSYNSQMCLQPLAVNGVGTLRVRVPVNEITFTRGGLREPLDFEVISRTSQDEQTADAQREYVASNSINKIWKTTRFIKDLRTQLSLDRTATQAGRYATTVGGNDGIQAYHFGVSYDHITENGVSFKGVPLGLRIQSDLISNEPHSIFLFVKHKNTIVIDNDMVRIIS
tara:strand:+ start:1060 stop:2388 length:1329 start_codon:yes stop_codon:yes gene_type:complete